MLRMQAPCSRDPFFYLLLKFDLTDDVIFSFDWSKQRNVGRHGNDMPLHIKTALSLECKHYLLPTRQFPIAVTGSSPFSGQVPDEYFSLQITHGTERGRFQLLRAFYGQGICRAAPFKRPLNTQACRRLHLSFSARVFFCASKAASLNPAALTGCLFHFALPPGASSFRERERKSQNVGITRLR